MQYKTLANYVNIYIFTFVWRHWLTNTWKKLRIELNANTKS